MTCWRCCSELSPAAELTIAETARQLRDEGEVLDQLAADALEEIGGGPAIPLAELRSRPPALARLVLRAMAESAAGGRRSLSRGEADAILALGQAGGSQALDLGGGLRARGRVRDPALHARRGRRAALAGGAAGARQRALRRLGGRRPARAPPAT